MRIKPKNLVAIPDLKTADEVLKKIADLKREILIAETDAQEQIDRIKDRLNYKLQPTHKEIEKLDLSLSAFANSQKDELFKGRKTVELPFGFLGFRLSTKISIKQATLKLLKQFGYKDAIIVKESVNKDVLATYPANKLAEVKATKISEDAFWYELKNEVQNS